MGPNEYEPNSLARRLLTPRQMAATKEMTIPPEEATVWVLMDNAAVRQLYKKKATFTNAQTVYVCSDRPDGAPFPRQFTHGIDAFDTELEAVQTARAFITKALERLISVGEELAARERTLTGQA